MVAVDEDRADTPSRTRAVGAIAASPVGAVPGRRRIPMATTTAGCPNTTTAPRQPSGAIVSAAANADDHRADVAARDVDRDRQSDALARELLGEERVADRVLR